MPLFRRCPPVLLTGAFAFMCLMLTAFHAEAAMVFCNRTQAPLEAALGYRGDTADWVSEGWWRIEPDQCARVFGQALTDRFYFYYATSLVRVAKDKPPFVWGGKYQFCADTKAFKASGDTDCENRGYQTKGFQSIDLGSNGPHDYTLDFRDGSEGR
jgi:uncharacterized membrane protein